MPSPGMPRKNKPSQNPASFSTKVMYMGFMDTVGGNYCSAIVQVIRCQLRRVQPAQAEVRFDVHTVDPTLRRA